MPTSNTTAEILRHYWAAMETNDFAHAAGFLTEDVVIDWPQSGERINGRAAFTTVNTAYPAEGRWHFAIKDLMADGNRVVTVTDIDDGVQKARAITFSTIDPTSGLIARQVEYWPDCYKAPPWRRQICGTIPDEDPVQMPGA